MLWPCNKSELVHKPPQTNLSPIVLVSLTSCLFLFSLPLQPAHAEEKVKWLCTTKLLYGVDKHKWSSCSHWLKSSVKKKVIHAAKKVCRGLPKPQLAHPRLEESFENLMIEFIEYM